MKKWIAGTIASLTLGLFLFASCAAHPGGTVGDICFEENADADCFEDEVCQRVEDGFGSELYCLARCKKQKDCADTERCNGVRGGSGKACFPKLDAVEDDGDFE